MKKILFLLAAGMIIGLSGSKVKSYFIIKRIPKELKKIDREYLNKAIANLYRSKLIDVKEDEDGNLIMVLTESGRKRILIYDFDKLKFKKQQSWDGYWRIIIFDIPEKFKKERNALSQKLKFAGAYSLQKSVFVYPYDIKDDVNFLIEFLNLRKYVRFIVAKQIDNELHLKKIFGLIK
ncbi:MAG: hypothetical protein NC935_03750 [Candidatus Omnitrophica bacterium]|nr:hypothetical protein [Candidatus Omnitrophota bacterium]